MNIEETFIKLTKKTYPRGYEREVVQLFPALPYELRIDNFNNYYLQIGENPSCMFTSHLDTASSEQVAVNHVFDESFIRTDKKTILGADCKAGVTLMLYMITNHVEGLYYFFEGEERGCIGSKNLARQHLQQPVDYLHSIKKVISFDRRGTNSVITHQSGVMCCSDTFADNLLTELNNNGPFAYVMDDTGICTDSLSFVGIIDECTNISVGYYREHTVDEYQDMNHLKNLAKALIQVNWEGI
jgi:hypothetical protein